jgi:hypothetical protein
VCGTRSLLIEVSDSRLQDEEGWSGVVIGTYEPAGEIVTGSFALD